MSKIKTKLNELQQRLEAPKNQYNEFGKYKYRSCEDILSAVKPLLGDAVLTLSDEIVQIGNRYYVKATAQLELEDEVEKRSAYAREPKNKKGMDESQITGATSSYARKYALNGLLAIDDTKDADSTNKHETSERKASNKQRKYITDLMREKSVEIDEMREKFDLDEGEKLTASQASKAIEWLKEMNTDKVVDEVAEALK